MWDGSVYIIAYSAGLGNGVDMRDTGAIIGFQRGVLLFAQYSTVAMYRAKVGVTLCYDYLMHYQTPKLPC